MGAFLLLPFFLIRFGLLAMLDQTAIRRAAHFPPMEKSEKTAYWLYQLSTAAIFVSLFFLHIKITPLPMFGAGLAVYAAGALLLILSMVHFARPSANGINQKGLYRISRNPMYVAYFIYFLGCVLLTQSFMLLGAVLLFQLTSHWIIRSEERWCIQTFGEEYLQYRNQVRRYF